MAENNQVATTGQTGLAKLKSILNAPSVVEQFQNALAENKNLFIASIIDLYNGDKSLQECNPTTIVQECLKAAVLDLPINRALGFAYIVVYKNKVKQTDPQTGRTVEVKVPTPTFIPGYKVTFSSLCVQVSIAQSTPMWYMRASYRPLIVYPAKLTLADKRHPTKSSATFAISSCLTATQRRSICRLKIWRLMPSVTHPVSSSKRSHSRRPYQESQQRHSV